MISGRYNKILLVICKRYFISTIVHFFKLKRKKLNISACRFEGLFQDSSLNLLDRIFFSSCESCSSTFDNRFDEKLGNESRRTSKARLTFRTRCRSRSFLKLKSRKKIIFDPVFNYSQNLPNVALTPMRCIIWTVHILRLLFISRDTNFIEKKVVFN